VIEFMMYRLRTILAVFAFVCLSLQLQGQATSSVTGIVSDPSGSVLPESTVTLTNPSTGTTYTGKTNSVGSYRITNVPPGPGYTIEVSHAGFNSYKVESVYVNVANVATQNVTLSPGTQVEISVSAAGQGVTLNTEDATIGNNVQVGKLNELPVQNRLTPAVLFSLQPGVTIDGSVTGARTDQNFVSVDGLDVNDLATGDFGQINGGAPVDSVQEFRGIVAGFTSGTGFGGGGQFALVTKSGSNQWHGQANIYHRDNSTMANDWFNNLAGIRAPKLVQNQFGGSIGGPIKHDRAFFFFDYTNSRIARQQSVLRTVPLPSFLAGNISYINNGAGCSRSSRQNTQPNCISQLTPAQVRNMDPAGIGESAAVFNLIKSRYPGVNDVTAGDGVNSGGFRFNAPFDTFTSVYVGRIDYNLTSAVRLWGRGTVTRGNQINTVQQFPGDPAAGQLVDRSYAYVGGLDWQIGANKFNQFNYGATVQDWNFPRPSNALGVNQVSFATGTTTLFSTPFSSPSNAQGRHIPIPQVQDNFTWSVGRHALSFGGTFKWIKASEFSTIDYNSLGVGLSGNVQGLTSSLRPSDLLPASTTAQVTYDSAFVAALGRVGSVNSTFNYDTSGNALPQPSGSQRTYQYYQTQVYFSDAWKVTPHLTLKYGLSYQYYSVPYEIHGLETAQTAFTFDKYIAARVAQSQSGNVNPDALPFLTYSLGGPKNNGPGLYQPDHKNFAPNVAFAWNPSFDSSTVFSGGIGTVYDRTIVNAVQYQQDQYNYLFQQSTANNYGSGADPVGSLANDPRYGSVPGVTPPSTPKPPFTPYVDASGPYGLPTGQFNQMIDPKLKTPYSIMANFGIQHQFSGSTLLKVSWVGRYGRRLLAQADASQLIDFPDKVSGQLMGDAIGKVTQQLRAGADPTNLPAQPWLENMLPAGEGESYGYPNTTSLVADNLQSLLIKGDFADTVQALSVPVEQNGFGLPYNVGMASQFASNVTFTSKGFSTYNGLLVSLQENLTHGLQFDLNYTWAHSIDNTSLIANDQAIAGYGFICDVLRPRLCRANSDFDVTHYITSYMTYQLPFGRGRMYGGNLPWLLDEAVGGWDLSNIVSWHSGNAFSTVSSAFVAGYANNAAAIFTGSSADIQRKVHKTDSGTLTLFADPSRAANAFVGPVGFQIGPRNSLRGPQYFNLDTGLAKTFKVVPDWGLNIKLRADAFNILNHPNFAAPENNNNYDDITKPSNFGQLTSMIDSTGQRRTSSRVLQISGRIEF
jgi:hypothetical protein